MNNELSCSQVLSLINFYIEDKLTPKMNDLVKYHLKNCKHCNRKYQELKNVLAKYKYTNKNTTNTRNSINLSNDLIKKLSEYVDNELNPDENVKIKKIAIANPNALKQLNSMYKFKQLMQNAYQKTKANAKIDYSKNVILKIQDSGIYTTTYFNKIIILFCILISIIIGGFIYLYL